MNWKIAIVFGILAILVIALAITKPTIAFSVNSDDDDDDDKKEKCKNKISMEEAINIALNYLKEKFGNFNYTLLKSEFEGEKYEFKFTNQTLIFEVKVNACNGEVIKVEIKKLELKPIQNLINQTEAIKIAIDFLKQNFGNKNYTLLKVEIKGIIYEIKITDRNNVYEVKINGVDGKIIKVETKSINLKANKEFEDKVKSEFKIINKTSKEGLKVEIEKMNTVLKINFFEKGNLSKTELELTLIFEKIIEFLDNGSLKGVFDNNDTVISFVNLHSLKWITVINNVTDLQGNLVEILIEQNANLTNEGKISLVYHIIPSSETLKILNQNVNVTIYKVKFDVYIEKFPWKNSSSIFGLQLKFNSEFEYKDKNLKVKFKTVGNITPFFEWEQDAYADGNLINVNATFDKNQIYLIYPRFNQTLEHDPSLGYEVAQALSTGTVTKTSTEFTTYTKTSTEFTTTTYRLVTTEIITITEIKDTTLTKTEITTLPSLFRDALFLIITLALILTVIVALIYRTKKIKEEIKI
jgi:Peptidase propeptide and YPEB domain.